MRTAPVTTGVLLLALASPSAGCGDSPTAPDDARVSALEVTGPATLAPGESRQFRALARFQNGSTGDVTAETSWWSSSTSVATAAGGGLVTARQNGDAMITGSYRGRLATLEVVVVPAGTFRLSGSLVDPVFPNAVLTNLTVEAVGRDGVTLTTTLVKGGFRFYGLAGPVRIRAADTPRFWLEPLDEIVDVNDHRTVTFQMPVKVAQVDASGRYTLTIAADPACRNVPRDGLLRSYLAEVSQRATLVNLRLTGATFVRSYAFVHDFIDGQADGDRLRLYLHEWTDSDPPYPGLYEELSPGRFYSAYGSAVLEHTASGFTGRMDGTVGVAATGETGSCRATGHVLTLAR